MMKTRYTLLITLWLSAACCLFTACNDDNEQEWNPDISDSEDLPMIGEGQFVVSYGTTDDASTRALSDEKLPPNKRISSLHYFVYDKETGNLIKNRQIRGIGPDTHWPIGNRDSMPWELRQDLQDTLMSGPTYRILFIANIDPTLFGQLPNGDPHPAVVRNVEKYESAKILLPQVPFSDNNMYYLWEDSLKADENNSTIKRNDVLLRRLVTRTDVKREDIKDTHLSDLIAKDLYKEELIRDAFEKHLDAFCVDMPDKMQGNYNDNATKLANFLKRPGIRDSLYNVLKSNVIEQFTKAIQASPYNKVITDWKTIKSVKLTYQDKKRCNALSLERKALYLEDWSVQTEENVPVENGRFSIVSFWGHVQNHNELKTMEFSNETSPIFTLDATSFATIKDMNRWYKITCNPVEKVEVKEGTATFNPQVDFETILIDNPNWKELLNCDLPGYDFKYYVEKKVFDACKDENKKKIYGENFTKFTFTNITLPNLQIEGIDKQITLVPSWTVPHKL